MDYFTTYESRMNAKGSDQKDSFLNSAKRLVSNSFSKSPSYKQVLINGIIFDSLISHTDNTYIKELIFKPSTIVSKGDIVELDGAKYLVLDFIFNEITPKAKMQFCNSTFTLSGETTKTQVGEDYLGRPIYDEVVSGSQNIPVIAESRIFNQPTSDSAINLPENKLQVTIQYIDHKDINYGRKFEMYNQKFIIIGIDYTQALNQKGILKLIGEREG